MLDTPVITAIYAGLLGVIFELLGLLFKKGLYRKILYLISLLLTSFSATVLLIEYFNIFSIFLFYIACFRVFNFSRIIFDRMEKNRSYHVTRRTSLMLIPMQLVSIGFLYLSVVNNIAIDSLLFTLVFIVFFVNIVILISLKRNLYKTSIKHSEASANHHLPTVSICIPARNETLDLTSCLESILAIDYPKLEIIVLDDCSHKQTSDIIKGFAKKGVRFIKGGPIMKGWLAKNQAYQTLAEAASSDFLFYCGVDVRMDKYSVTTLVNTMLYRNKSMISILPRTKIENTTHSLLQPIRYWWELALPRRSFNRPPALSTAWMIKRDVLLKIGGFKAVNNTVVPESYLAKELSKTNQYSFIRSNSELEVITAKTYSDQKDTFIRLRYPQLRKRPESVLVLSLSEIAVLFVPLFSLAYGLLFGHYILWSLALINCIVLYFVHYRILKVWLVGNSFYSFVAFPISVLVEIWLLHLSMWKYEFGVVEWKQRNICIPVMQVIPRLPKI